MHFARTEEQDQLADTVAALQARRSDSAAARAAAVSADGFDRALWQTLCDQVGVAGLAIPEEHEGAGGTLVESAVALEELGRSLTPSPLLGTSLATVALRLHGSAAARAELLPRLAAGEIGTVVWDGATGIVPRSSVGSAGGRLTGVSPRVLDATAADLLLVVADGRLWSVARDAASVSRVSTMDQILSLASVVIDDVPGVSLGEIPDLRPLHSVGAALATAVQLGVACRGLEMTVSYARQREQFGRPIGSFQALKHRMADLLVQVEAARSASWAATAAAAAYVDEPGPVTTDDLLTRAAIAQSWCSDALDQVAAETVQLHGGIAITWEHDAQLVLKRAQALSQLFGQAHEHRARLLVAPGGDPAGDRYRVVTHRRATS